MEIKKVEIYAHRGGAGLYPETSLAAYQNALALDVDVLDMDVGLTLDTVLVAYHDRALNPAYTRYADGRLLKRTKTFFIQDFTFEQLQDFEIGILDRSSRYAKQFPDQHPVPGSRIPSVREIFELGLAHSNKNLRFQIEVKTDPRYPHTTANPEIFAERIASLIEEFDLYARVEVHSFDWRNLLALQKIDERICTSFITSRYENVLHFLTSPFTYSTWFAGFKRRDYDSWPALIAALGGKIWCPDFKDVTVKLVDTAHALGLLVVPWSVDTVKDLQQMMDQGVDGIITNRPDRLRELL